MMTTSPRLAGVPDSAAATLRVSGTAMASPHFTRICCRVSIPNAVRVAELAGDKPTQTLPAPVSARRQLNDLPDELWISIEFYLNAMEAVFKALAA